MRAYLITSIVLLTACSGGDEGSRTHSFRVFSENGVIIAESVGGPKFQGELFHYHHQTFIKQDDTLPASLIGRVGYCYVGPEDQVFIGDRRGLRIAVFNRDGDFVREIGRRGNGPGEFRQINLLGIIDGMVVVADKSLMRTSLFHPDGRFIRIFPFPRGNQNSEVPFSAFSAYPADDLIVADEQFITMTEDGVMTIGRTAVYTADGMFVAGILREAVPSPDPFRGMPSVEYQPATGIYQTNGIEPEIHHYRLDGTLEKLIRVEYGPVPVTEEDRRKTIQHQEVQIESAIDDGLRRLRQEQLNSFSFPAVKDFSFDLAIDEYGYIWASEPRGVYDMPPWTRRYHIINPDGEYLGLTTPPEVDALTAKVHFTRGFLVYSYFDNESGEPVVEIFRITPVDTRFRYP